MQVASTSGPTTNESAGEVPIVLDTFAGAGSAKRKLPMQCQVHNALGWNPLKTGSLRADSKNMLDSPIVSGNPWYAGQA